MCLNKVGLCLFLGRVGGVESLSTKVLGVDSTKKIQGGFGGFIMDTGIEIKIVKFPSFKESIGLILF